MSWAASDRRPRRCPSAAAASCRPRPRGTERLPTRPQRGVAAEHALEQLVLIEVQRRIVGRLAAQEGLLPIAANGRAGPAPLSGGRRISRIARRPASACCWAATICSLDGRKVRRQGIERLRHHLADLADAGICVLCCSACASRSLAMAATRASFRASIDLSLPSNCSSFSPTGRTAELQRRLAHAQSRRHRRRMRRRAAGRRWQLLDLAVDGIQHQAVSDHLVEQAVELLDPWNSPIGAGRLGLAMQEIGSDLFLGLVQQLAEAFPAARSVASEGIAVSRCATVISRAAHSHTASPPLPAGQSTMWASGLREIGLARRDRDFFCQANWKAIL